MTGEESGCHLRSQAIAGRPQGGAARCCGPAFAAFAAETPGHARNGGRCTKKTDRALSTAARPQSDPDNRAPSGMRNSMSGSFETEIRLRYPSKSQNENCCGSTPHLPAEKQHATTKARQESPRQPSKPRHDRCQPRSHHPIKAQRKPPNHVTMLSMNPPARAQSARQNACSLNPR